MEEQREPTYVKRITITSDKEKELLEAAAPIAAPVAVLVDVGTELSELLETQLPSF